MRYSGRMWRLFLPVVAATVAAAQHAYAPLELPASATIQLVQSLEAARPHASHVWRDTPAVNQDGTVNGYIEITRGDRRKWELDMKSNERTIDRMIAPKIGGYPVN